jgi:uncharacterized membrane protein YjgN (DUF898 family)
MDQPVEPGQSGRWAGAGEGRYPGELARQLAPRAAAPGLLRHLEPGPLRDELARAAGLPSDDFLPPLSLAPEHRAPLVFDGTGAEYFRLWAVHLLLTLLSLGVYSAWAKVRKARWFAQHTVLMGDRFDYHGEPWRVLLGRVLALLLVLGWSWAFDLAFWAGIAMLVLLCGLGPVLFASAQRFRLSNTSWRGLRFGHEVSKHRAYAVCVPLLLLWTSGTVLSAYAAQQGSFTQLPGWSVPVLSAVTFLAFPWAHARLKHLQHAHASFGSWRFDFSPVTAGFYGLYALGVVLFIAAAALLMLAVFAIQSASGERPSAGVPLLLTLVPMLLLLWLLSWPYLAARQQQLVWHATRLNSTLRFESSIQGRRLQGLIFRQTALVLLTFGLYWPFAVVAIARYRVECLSVVSDGVRISEARVPARQAVEQRATGDAAAEGFGLDLGW